MNENFTLNSKAQMDDYIIIREIIQKAQKAYKAEKEKDKEAAVQMAFYTRKEQEQARYAIKILENIFGVSILKFGIK